VYRVVIYPEAQDQIEALPAEALAAFAELLGAIELAPWNGPPHHEDNPHGAVRRWPFGPSHAGHVIYLILGPAPRSGLPMV
jgi:hypothetical protein